jgi:hypothetical protein
MGRLFTGRLVNLHLREARAWKTADARTILDMHIRAIAAARDELTSEQADRLRASLPLPAGEVTRLRDLPGILAGALVTLAVIGLTGFVVVRLGASTPAITAAVLTAFAAVLAAVPPIIKALRR